MHPVHQSNYSTGILSSLLYMQIANQYVICDLILDHLPFWHIGQSDVIIHIISLREKRSETSQLEGLIVALSKF